jgi:hypothetical protein
VVGVPGRGLHWGLPHVPWPVPRCLFRIGDYADSNVYLYELRAQVRGNRQAGCAASSLPEVRRAHCSGVECTSRRFLEMFERELVMGISKHGGNPNYKPPTKKAKTQAQLDRATDLRLQKAYNITLADYEKMEKTHGGKCWISGRPPGSRRLHVDHDHSWKKVKITTSKLSETGNWVATANYLHTDYTGYGAKKSLAVREVKRKLLRASVRGLLTYSINAGLQKFSDDPKLLRVAADYLEKHQGPLTGQETT